MNYIIVGTTLIIAMIGLQLSIYTLVIRQKIFYQGLLGMGLSLFIYSLFYVFELTAMDVDLMKLFASFQRIGIMSLPAFWVIMALEYTNKKRYLTPRFYAALFFIPILCIFLVFTDHSLHLFYNGYTATQQYSLSIANITPGIGYIIGAVYINIMLLLGTAIYINYIFKNSMFKRRSLILMATSFIPWIGYWIYMSGILPLKIDINPIFLAAVSFIYTMELLRDNIFNTTAIARHIVFDNINEIVVVVDMENRIIDINKMAEEFLVKTAAALIGKDIRNVFVDTEEFAKSLLEKLEDKKISFDFEMNTAERLYYFRGEISQIKQEGKVIILRDNTEEVRMINDLRTYASMDLLTKVYNRNFFNDIAQEQIKDCAQNKRSFSLVMMDIDRFKEINDTYGHSTGDMVLSMVADICRKHLGNQGFIGRFGGDEFVMGFENLPEEEIGEIIERIRVEIMDTDFMYNDTTLKTTCSFGIYTMTGMKDLDEWIKNADEALYQSKRLGRNKIHRKLPQ